MGVSVFCFYGYDAKVTRNPNSSQHLRNLTRGAILDKAYPRDTPGCPGTQEVPPGTRGIPPGTRGVPPGSGGVPPGVPRPQGCPGTQGVPPGPRPQGRLLRRLHTGSQQAPPHKKQAPALLGPANPGKNAGSCETTDPLYNIREGKRIETRVLKPCPSPDKEGPRVRSEP